ncbi:MAG: hypothetical protein APF77_10530 [Clostridia bacterium BRH_c25]|nr:MAG: hypothetical protein APF77_10530 [Clostridia bacterium BRH_c25]
MTIIITCSLFIVGLLFIIKGGDWFIDSAAWVARITGMPEVFIGATIVSLGTTFPELMVSTTSAIRGHTDMALGNAIGSTICNIGLVLGISNLISPSKINSRIYNIKAVIMVCCAVAFIFMAQDGKIDIKDTILLLMGLIIYIFVNLLEVDIKKNFYKGKKTDKHAAIEPNEARMNGLKFITGAGLVIIGARMLVDNGIIIANLLKIPDMVISLTLIALGTSLPELVTSIAALIKGHRNMAVGNIIGANILNLTMVIGVSSLFRSLTVPLQIIKLDLPYSLTLMTVLTVPTVLTRKISRLHAAVLLMLYATYLYILFIIK